MRFALLCALAALPLAACGGGGGRVTLTEVDGEDVTVRVVGG